MKEIILIAAVAEGRVIGKDGTIPWHHQDEIDYGEDLSRFKDLTLGHVVVMGRRTYESLGRPLPKRTNVVITRNRDYDVPKATVVRSLEEALRQEDDKIYVIGGQEIYEQAMPLATRLEITEIHANYGGDTFFPEIDEEEWEITKREDRGHYSFLTYVRKTK